VHEDKEGAVKRANNHMASHTTKHTDIRHHCTKELVDVQAIAVTYIPTSDMHADALTKALLQPKHTMLFKLCLVSID
jgi:hypothetical protein